MSTLPTLAWGDRDSWTACVLSAVAASQLTDVIPKDYRVFAPAYDKFNDEQRTLFWSHLISITAKYESDFDPRNVTGDVEGTDSIGLLQLSYEDEESYGITMGLSRSQHSLQDAETNIRFAVLIMEKLLLQDEWISRHTDRWRGLAEYWITLRPTDAAFEGIRSYMLSLSL